VNVSWQAAVPVVPVAVSVQLFELPNDPDVGAAVKLTVPVGMGAPLTAVSLTVAVHEVPLPTGTEDGEHPTLVDVVRFVAVTVEDWPLLVS
jgi:hypothetical protein